MPRIHVVAVEEFSGLIDRARALDGVSVSAVRHGYYTISSDEDLVFDRRDCGFKPALWYSCLSGGVDGVIVEYSRERLRITKRGG